MEYLTAIFLTCIAIPFNRRMSSRLRITYYIFILLYIILLMGLRYRVGMDTLNYMASFRFAPTLNELKCISLFEQRFEPGYLLICAFFKSITNEFWPVQIFLATITNSCIFIFIYRYCKNPFVGICFYFIFTWLYFSTEIIRESAAIGLFLLNYQNLQKKAWIKYYLFSLLSLSLHYSACITWFFPLARYLKPNFIFFIICIMMLAITPIVQKFNEMLAIAAIAGRVDQYVESAEELNLNWRLVTLIKTAFPATVALVLSKRIKPQQGITNMVLLHVIFCAGSFAIPIIFSRFTNYTSLFYIILLANVFVLKKIAHKIKCIIIVCLLLSQVKYYIEMYFAWIPYVSIFEPKQIKERELLWYDYFGN